VRWGAAGRRRVMVVAVTVMVVPPCVVVPVWPYWPVTGVVPGAGGPAEPLRARF
jgi:hypothetical protein